jgi:activator of HSP90 ATPase
MDHTILTETRTSAYTRRQALAGIGLALGSVVVATRSKADPTSAGPIAPAAKDNSKRTEIQQVVNFTASPQSLYEALLDSTKFAAFTGLPAEIDPTPGGAFSLFGGLIVGRTIELLANQRIVQAWKPANWPAGVYSLVTFELQAAGAGTTVVFDHKGFPEGGYDHLLAGWDGHYWGPLAKYFG